MVDDKDIPPIVPHSDISLANHPTLLHIQQVPIYILSTRRGLSHSNAKTAVTTLSRVRGSPVRDLPLIDPIRAVLATQVQTCVVGIRGCGADLGDTRANKIVVDTVARLWAAEMFGSWHHGGAIQPLDASTRVNSAGTRHSWGDSW